MSDLRGYQGARQLDGAFDAIEGPTSPHPAADPDGDGVTDEIPTALVDFMEFYLLTTSDRAVEGGLPRCASESVCSISSIAVAATYRT